MDCLTTHAIRITGAPAKCFVAIFAIGLLVLGPAAWAVDYQIRLGLGEEIPAPALDGAEPSGEATVSIDSTTGAVTVTGTYTGTTSAVTAAHLHGPAARGETAGVILGLTVTGGMAGDITGGGTLTDTQLTTLLEGRVYLNVHTANNGAGEIRGQVTETDHQPSDDGGSVPIGIRIDEETGRAVISIDSVLGSFYDMEASPNLLDFVTEVEGVPGTGEQIEFQDPDVPSQPKYFRVRQYETNPNSPGTITSWADVVGGTAGEGLNYDVTKSAISPSLATLPGSPDKIYAAWREAATGHQIRVSVYNGNDSSPGWTRVDSKVSGVARAAREGINYSPSNMARLVVLVVFDGKLFAAWSEAGQLRLAEYNGNDGAPDWTFRDGNGATGLNYDSDAYISNPDAEVYNGELFLTWTEFATNHHVRARKMNTSYTFTWVDGGAAQGLNYNSGRDARIPSLAVLGDSPGKLYLGFQESNQARVKVSSNGTSFSAADGGGATGLNHDTADSAIYVKVQEANGMLYAVWLENSTNIRVRSYDGSNDASPTWNWEDGGGALAGINYDNTKSAPFRALSQNTYSFRGDLYVAWSEMNASNQRQARMKSFDGASWTFHDGGAANSNINYSSSTHGMSHSFAELSNKLYFAWTEGREDPRTAYRAFVSVGQ